MSSISARARGATGSARRGGDGIGNRYAVAAAACLLVTLSCVIVASAGGNWSHTPVNDELFFPMLTTYGLTEQASFSLDGSGAADGGVVAATEAYASYTDVVVAAPAAASMLRRLTGGALVTRALLAVAAAATVMGLMPLLLIWPLRLPVSPRLWRVTLYGGGVASCAIAGATTIWAVVCHDAVRSLTGADAAYAGVPTVRLSWFGSLAAAVIGALAGATALICTLKARAASCVHSPAGQT
jgi:hypothetical protein